jgi:hypothetical protein
MGRMVVTRHEKSEFEDTFLLRRFFVTSGVITTALIGAANSLTFDDGRKKSKIVIRAPPAIRSTARRAPQSPTCGFKGSARGFSALETFGDATKVVKTMLVAIQKDPTIDAVFSIGSCCGPGMGGRSRTARRPRLSVVRFSARSTYWPQYAHQGVQRPSEPRSCSGVSCISVWHRHAKLALAVAI